MAKPRSPKNQVQLLTDISVHPNMTGDDVILTDRIAGVKERTAIDIPN